MTDYDWLALQRTAHDEFSRRLEQVTDWDAPTPDTDWNVRQLVQHVIDEQQWVSALLTGMTTRQAQGLLNPLSDDLKAEWRQHSERATNAWREASHDAPVHLSYDTVTVREYLAEQVSDVAVHTWDLAKAVGADEKLDDDLVEAVWSVFAPQKETLEASGLFASPVAVDEDAPLQSRLLALTGRDVRAPFPS